MIFKFINQGIFLTIHGWHGWKALHVIIIIMWASRLFGDFWKAQNFDDSVGLKWRLYLKVRHKPKHETERIYEDIESGPNKRTKNNNQSFCCWKRGIEIKCAVHGGWICYILLEDLLCLNHTLNNWFFDLMVVTGILGLDLWNLYILHSNPTLQYKVLLQW